MRGAHLRALTQRAFLAAWILLLVSAAAVAGVTPPGSPPPGPPYPPPVNDVVVYDYADLFSDETEASATATIVAIEERVKAEIVVYTQLKPGSDEGSTESDAAALIDQYGVGRLGFDDGVAILFNMNREVCRAGVSGNGQVQLFAGPGYRATFLSDGERQAIFDNDMLPRLRECDMDGALLVALEKIDANATLNGPPPPPGPPYPPPVVDVVVYDYADLFTDATEASATATIVAIEERVKAEIVVYTQLKPGSDEGSTESDAAALIDQYGVGRLGFDDGVAILFNMNREVCRAGVSGNGQVQLFAGPGYRATFLSDGERQAIFDNDMLPLLRQCDMDGALLVALEKIDANATADHARALSLARQADAAVGLVGAPVAFLVLVGIAARSWLRYGRDPVYLDSPSILMPAPPPDLTAASGALVWEGKTTRRALTTAMLDLASRGEISFRTEKKLLGADRAGIQLLDEPPADPYVIRNRRRPLSGAEEYALTKLRVLPGVGQDGYLSPSDIEGFATSVPGFTQRLEKHVASKGWFREPPAKAVSRWAGRGVILMVIGITALIAAANLPSGGLSLLAAALVAAGIAIMLIARFMPARTMAGAMIYAMLAAYRRTLHKTMEQARSMNEVVDQAQLEWLETPDQAVVWGVALGLHNEVETVLARSVEDAQAGVTSHSPWVPAWYGSQSSFGSTGGGGRGGLAPGLFSSSAVPNFGGMMAALGSIGSAPSSSGGSGGFGGGSSGGGGGGGGGAGGGF